MSQIRPWGSKWVQKAAAVVLLAGLAVTAAASPAAASPAAAQPSQLRIGDSGPAVSCLQHGILYWGYREWSRPGFTDGAFGSATQAAVNTFKRNYGLAQDGVFGHGAGDKLRAWFEAEDKKSVGSVPTAWWSCANKIP